MVTTQARVWRTDEAQVLKLGCRGGRAEPLCAGAHLHLAGNDRERHVVPSVAVAPAGGSKQMSRRAGRRGPLAPSLGAPPAGARQALRCQRIGWRCRHVTAPWRRPDRHFLRIFFFFFFGEERKKFLFPNRKNPRQI